MKNVYIIFCISIFIIILANSTSYGGIASLSVTVKNISNNAVNNGNIIWSGVTNDGTTNWKRADQYLEIHYKCDYQGWGMQIFTDNVPIVPADVPPYPFTAKYVLVPEGMPEGPDATPGVVPLCKKDIIGYTAGDFAAGLVHDTGKYALPMCWRVTGPRDPNDPNYPQNPNGQDPFTIAEQPFELSIEEVEDADPDTDWHHLKRTNDANNYYCWIHMKDKSMDGKSDPKEWANPITGTVTWQPNSNIKWANGGSYQTVANSQGIQHGEETFEGWGIYKALDGQADGLYGIIVYLGAKFTNVAGGDFRTKVYVEMYHY